MASLMKFGFSALLFNIWIVYADAALSCSQGFLLSSSGKCFNAYSDQKSWTDAKTFCNNLGGDLARIDTEDDQTVIAGIVEGTQDGTPINLTTGNDYHYHYMHDQGLDITGTTSIVFQVENCNDAHIALSQTKGVDTKNTYEIVIGGWGNTQSVIRTCKQCTNHATTHTNHYDNCRSYRSFWISWDSGTIQVGRGRLVKHNTFMSWKDPNPHPVNYIAFATGWGSIGKWKFQVGNVLPGIFWIGGTNAGTNKWHWTNNANFAFTNWAPHMPFNAAVNHCVMIDPNQFDLWKNDNCSATMNYVCQKMATNAASGR